MAKKPTLSALTKARRKIRELERKLNAQIELRLAAESKLLTWHSISSAPRDGTPILVKGDEGNPSVASFHAASDGQAGWVGGIANGKPLVLQRLLTHWCRLPEDET